MKTRIWVLAVAALIVLEVIHQYYLTRTNPTAIYLDTLRFLSRLDQWESGDLTLLQYWDYGQHRGLVYQFVLYLNVTFFKMNVLLANRMTGLVVLATSLIVINSFVSSIGSRILSAASAWVLFLCVLMAWMLFSWAGWECFVSDLGLTLWIKTLALVAFYAAYDGFLRSKTARRTLAWWLSAAVSGIILVISMGWSYAFVGTLVAVQVMRRLEPAHRRLSWSDIPTLAAIVSLVLYYVVGGGVGPSNQGAITAGTFSVLSRVPNVVASGLGSLEPLISRPGGPTLIYLLGCAMLAVGAYVLYARLRRGLSTASLVPVYFILQGLLTAASVTIARNSYSGLVELMASRYYSELGLLVIGIVWLLAEEALDPSARAARLKTATLVILSAMIVLTQAVTMKREWVKALHRSELFELMKEALRWDPPDAEDATLLQSDLNDTLNGRNVLAARRLAMFRDDQPQCAIDRIGFGRGWHGKENGGRWTSAESRLRVPPCSCDLVFALHVPESMSRRQAVITGASGTTTTSVDLSPGSHTLVRFPASSADSFYRIVTSPASPPDAGADGRQFGALWSEPKFDCRRTATAQVFDRGRR